MVTKPSTELAQRYLITIGAKALILEEKGTSKEQNLEGQAQELLAKQEMLLEEDTKRFKRCMHLDAGVLVNKRGRNGSTRAVHIRYVRYANGSHNGAFGITWKSSRMGLKKIFDVSQLTSAPDMTNGGKEDGFVRLQNSSRSLQLKFEFESQRLFLHHLKSFQCV